MDTVTVSSKFQVVIPRSVRERLGLAAGQRVQVFAYDGRIEIIPVKPMRATRGFLADIETDVPRDDDRA